jgi:O-antigen/teichoic acid export membrane protein
MDKQPLNSEPRRALASAIASGQAMLSERRAVVHSGFWSLVLRIAGLVSGFALGVVLARTLGPAEFGIYGLVTTASLLAVTVAQLGTPQLAVRELSVRSVRGDWPGVTAVLYSFGTATMIAGTVLGVVAITVAWSTARRSELLYVGQGVLLTLLVSVTALSASELRGLGSMIRGQMMDILVRPGLTFLIILAMVAAAQPLRADIALWIQIGVTLLAAVVSLIWIRHGVPTQFRSARPKMDFHWLRVALPLGAVDVLRQLDGAYGVILVGWMNSGVELGVFRVAVACVALSAMPVTIFHIILAPSLSRLNEFGKTSELQQLLSWTSAAMIGIMAPITLAAWLIGRPLISFVFGAPYASAWLPLFLLTCAQLAYGIFGMGPILLAMSGGERQLIRIYVLAVGTAIAAAIPMTIAWGSAGAAAGPVITALIIGLLSRRYGRAHLGVEITCLPLIRRLFT